MWFLLLLLLPGVRLQEDDSPQKDNPYRLPYNSVQFVEHTASKKGPILFPNDAPPPPPTPLIVTSRPLIESIARSELNPNNSIAAQSQYHQVQFRPDYLARSRTYKPYAYGGPSTPVYDYRPPNLGYIVTTVRPDKDNYYKEYEFSQGINSRKGDFDHEVNMKHIKDWHTSLYSRETEDNDQVADHNIENQNEQSLNDLNENIFRKKRSTLIENNKKGINRNSERTQAKSLLSIEKFNQNVREIFNTPSKNQGKHRNRRLNEPFSQEFLSSSQEKSPDANLYYSTSSRTKTEQSTEGHPNNRPSVKFRKLENIQKHTSDTNQAYNDEVRARGLSNLRKTNKQLRSGEWERYSEDEANLLKRRPTQKDQNDQYIDKEVNPPPLDDDLTDFFSNKPNEMAKDNKAGKTVDKDVNLKYQQEEKNHQKTVLKKRGNDKKFGNDIYQDQENNSPTPKVANNKYQGESPEILNYDGGRENSKEYNHVIKDHKTGDDFSHSQQSTGSATNGEYRVRLPDGRMQIVSYTADENGYKAKVRYDEHTGADNSIDVNVNKGDAYRPPTPITFKPIDHIYNDNLDSFENDDYVRQRFNEQKILKPPLPVQQPASSYNTVPQNLYGANQNNFQIHNDLRSKHVLDTTKYLNKDRVDDLTDTNNEFLKHYHEKFDGNNKLHRNKGDDYKFSQEISDYSSELGHSNQHHNSKFADFYDNNEGEANGKVTPTYDELKQLFGLDSNSQQHSVSTVRPYDEVTEDVVAITPKKPNLYTNVNLYKNPLTATPSPFPYSPSPTTPSSYLYSTIANLKERITFGHKPVLSHQYLNKINKYLTFK
ncbi:hypothetical protein HF086_010976 [Spodoptera exigua]|uniref:Cuticular protein RR-2 n=1 Tax=Spodoptera exigua TaxID=7107 RepID=A0A922MFV5_SPOEX|nr:hypothetical protein HF086_010976 [Spodoptera exigua]